MTYKGKFKPTNPTKYKGDVREIVYRSSWELKMMKYCDTTKSIIEWGSEEFALYYRGVDNKIHRYYPDFFMKVRQPNGTHKKFLIEIKPKKQTLPPKKPGRKTKRYLTEVLTYAKNQSKWEAATAYANKYGMTFEIWHEDTLRSFGIKIL